MALAALVPRALLALDADDDDSDSVDDARAGPTDLTRAQLRAVRAVVLACCALSLLGCASVFVHFARQAAARRRSNVVPRMVAALSLLDACFSVPKMFDIPDGIGQSAGADARCQAQAFVLQLAGLACTYSCRSLNHDSPR